MITRDEYEQAKANGKAEQLRGDMISKRIAKRYPLNAQVALLFDIDTKPEEVAEYQAFRAEVKDEVDEILAGFEEENSNGLYPSN